MTVEEIEKGYTKKQLKFVQENAEKKQKLLRDLNGVIKRDYVMTDAERQMIANNYPNTKRHSR